MTAARGGWDVAAEAARQGLIPPEVIARARESSDFNLVDVLEALGGEALQRGNDRLAEQLYLAALGEGSVLPGVAFNLGNIAARAERLREAIDWYSRAIDLDPALGRAYYNRGVQKRKLGDEPGARLDITAAIERGYDGLEVYAALLRGRSGEFGDPVEALEQAVIVRQAVAAGEVDAAVTLMELQTELRRGRADSDLRGELALVIALENERHIRQQMGEVDQATAVEAELVGICGRLAVLNEDAWVGVPDVLREFVVGQMPRRLVTMIGLYAQSGRHQDALAAAEEAQRWGGSPGSGNPLLADISIQIANAVYLEIRQRARAAERSAPGEE